MIRLMAHTEMLDDNKTSVAALISHFDIEIAKKLLGLLGIDHEIEEVEHQDLFTVEITTDKRGVRKEGLTREEVVQLVQKETPTIIFTEEAFIMPVILENSRRERVAIEKWNGEQLDEELEASDAITNILHVADKTGKAKGVLRRAVANFVCEKEGEETLEPNPEILKEMAGAILTPVYLQE